jgi:hypothetical protein
MKLVSYVQTVCHNENKNTFNKNNKMNKITFIYNNYKLFPM